jgi:hypothetical protein
LLVGSPAEEEPVYFSPINGIRLLELCKVDSLLAGNTSMALAIP